MSVCRNGSRRKSDTYKGYFSWAVSDGTLDASKMSQTIETRLPAATGPVTIPDPSDTLGDPVVEQTMSKLIETAGRLVANSNAPGSGVTAPYGTIDDTGRVQLSQDAMTKEGNSDATLQTRSSKIPDRKMRGSRRRSVPSD